MAFEKGTVAERFERRVDKSDPDGCWPWTGGRSSGGYGVVRKTGRLADGSTTAHRMAWQLTYGPIPDGVEVCHRCDTPPCVRPDHLFLGTSRENAADMVAKGRQSHHSPPDQRGERNHGARLTDAQVAEMRALFDGGVVTNQRRLAAMFGTSYGNVHCIVRRKSRV